MVRLKTKRYDMKKVAKSIALFGISLIGIGALLELIGQGNFKIGNLYINSWIFTFGIIAIVIALRNYHFGKEMVIDERRQLISLKSMKTTLLTVIYILLGFIIAASIHPTDINLSFVSWSLLILIIIVYKISYMVFSKRY